MSEHAEVVPMADRTVRGDWVNVEVYALFKAVTELFGERGWEVTWRAGEIAFEQLRQQLGIAETRPVALIELLSNWFVEVGYAKEIVVNPVTDRELIYEVEAGIPEPAARKLRAEKAVSPHLTASVMMAGLKQMCGVEAKIESLRAESVSPTRSRQRWTLRPLNG